MKKTEHADKAAESHENGREQERQRVNAWAEVGVFLREDKRRELLAISDLAKYIDFFDDAFEMSRKTTEPSKTSGLIEMQDIFARAVSQSSLRP
ncbi:MAG: hypothetical protein HQM09_23260 [Candidatus Riflebacteria bacterium]|nr:hypothetical protein [Candidatus Riflebacteria bacterium]